MAKKLAVMVSYTNQAGQLVTVPAVKPKVERKHKEARHDGWLAMGLPPEQIEVARRRHTSPEAFMVWQRTALRTRIRKQPFSSSSAALDACELAKKAGWLGVGVVEKRVD